LQENGIAIVMGLVIAFGGLFGFKQWQLWQQNKARRASAEYTALSDFLKDEKLDAAVPYYETLKKEYSGSAYASLAALQMAHARVDAGQADLAAPMLQFVMSNGIPEPLKIIARERLARLRLDQNKPDAALKLLDESPTSVGFEARFDEIRGDIYRQKGDRKKAAQYYTQALAKLESGVGYRPLLELKLEDLAVSMPDEGESS